MLSLEPPHGGLSYVGPISTWNKITNNLKTATSVNWFKLDIKKHFLKKLSGTETDIYSLEHNQDKYTFCFYFFLHLSKN